MNITWEDVQQACVNIANQSKAYEPDCIVAVSRGGLIPARILASILNIKNIYSLGIATYSDANTQTDTLVYQSPFKDIINSTHKLAIVVDDIADSGNTFKYISKAWVEEDVNTSCVFASLYVRASCKLVPSIYYKKIETNDWIIFPWEAIK